AGCHRQPNGSSTDNKQGARNRSRTARGCALPARRPSNSCCASSMPKEGRNPVLQAERGCWRVSLPANGSGTDDECVQLRARNGQISGTATTRERHTPHRGSYFDHPRGCAPYFGTLRV
ncbi:hypothetical protein TRAPUB_1272, partial [Trametes pubescens]